MNIRRINQTDNISLILLFRYWIKIQIRAINFIRRHR